MKRLNLACCLCLLACGGNSERSSVVSNGCAVTAGSQWLSGQVSAVIDGDTLVLKHGLGLWAQPQPIAPWVFRNGEDPAVPVCAD